MWKLSTIENAVHEDESSPDEESKVILLADGSKWQLWMRPCSTWEEGMSEGSDENRLPKSNSDSNNFMGLWLQHRDDLDNGRVMTFLYTLTLKTNTGRTIATHSDFWRPEYKHQMRGSYWFASFSDLRLAAMSGRRRNQLGLNVVLSVNLDNWAGDVCSVDPVVDLCTPKNLLFQVKEISLPVHASLIPASKQQNLRPICLDNTLGHEPALLKILVRLLYYPTISKLEDCSITQLCSLAAAADSLELHVQKTLIIRSVVRKIQTLDEVLQCDESLRGQSEWQPFFWRCVHDATYRTEEWDRLQGFASALRKSGLVQRNTLVNFLSRRPSLLAISSRDGVEEVLSYVFTNKHMLRAFASDIMHFLNSSAPDLNGSQHTLNSTFNQPATPNLCAA